MYIIITKKDVRVMVFTDYHCKQFIASVVDSVSPIHLYTTYEYLLYLVRYIVYHNSRITI